MQFNFKRSRSVLIDALESRRMLSSTLTVSGKSDLWVLSGITLSGQGTTPPMLTLPAGVNRVVTFSSVTGTVHNSPSSSSGPDGETVSTANAGVTAEGGISGITTSTGKNFFAMLGLFTGNTVPASNPPASLNYAPTVANTSFAPLLDQSFFVGDGLTGTGSGTVQKFNVPNGATRLYLGFADPSKGYGAPAGYNTNSGTLSAVVNVTVPPTTGTISGTVYNDINGNGSHDSTESGLANVTLFIDANNNGKLDSGEKSTTSSSSGAYSFTNVAPGTFSVREIVPSTYRATTTNPVSAKVTAGVTTTVNFEDSQTAVITGYVFNDANGNKTKDAGENSISGMTVYLDLNDNGSLDFIDIKTTTNSSGEYTFVVPAGTYTVREVVPSGYSQTTVAKAVTISPAVTVTENIGDEKS